MKRLHIGVDVDICVVRSDVDWMNWLFDVTQTTWSDIFDEERFDPHLRVDYDLSSYFRDLLEERGIDGMDFWRRRDLYDNMIPSHSAVWVVDQLHEAGHKITFVSKLKGDHHKSKCYFLKKHFPYLNAIICTHEKGALSGALDVMIDDRMSNLLQFDVERTPHLILSPSPYKQDDYDGSNDAVLHAIRRAPYEMDWNRGWDAIGKIIESISLEVEF